MRRIFINSKVQPQALEVLYTCMFNYNHSVSQYRICIDLRLRSHRSRLFGYTVYVFEGTRILEIKHYDFLIPGRIGGHYSKSSYRRV